jgi:short-subunit dehydrogenase
LAIANELVACGATVIITSRSPAKLPGIETIDGVEMQSDTCGERVVNCLNGRQIDVLINNAGYFYEPVETLANLNFAEELKMIDICAVGPLRITSALVNAKLLSSQAKVVCITSQGGSIGWRFTQNPNGHDYGHHMSKAAANMMAVLLSQELKDCDVPVGIFHPGFNKTEMTSKYAAIWEVQGAVDSTIGAKRVCHEICRLSMATTGKFINCEDGLEIPY